MAGSHHNKKKKERRHLMIFYFTGTGNSLYVAKYLDTELVSIPQVMKEKELSFQA